MNAVVYVVDDDAAVRRAIERLLRAAGYRCRVFDGACSFLGAAWDPCEAACLVLDIRMPGMSGTELQARLRGTDHDVPIVFVTGHGDIPTCVKTMKAGAVSFLPKPFDGTDLLGAVEEALERARRMAEERARLRGVCARYRTLTSREREVCGLVVQGLLNKQIAARLGIVEKTVKVHRGRVMAKMGVRSVAALVRAVERLKPMRCDGQESRHG